MEGACILVGAGGHARALLGVLLEADRHARCAAVIDVNQADGKADQILGVPVEYGRPALRAHFERGVSQAYVAIGDAAERRRFFDECGALGFDLPNLISRTATISAGVVMGRGNFIGPRSFVGPLSRLGHNNIVNTAAILEHETQIADDCHIAPGAVLAGRVVVGSRVFVGLGARVIDKVRVASDITIGAGGVVVADLTEPGIYIGIPARRSR